MTTAIVAMLCIFMLAFTALMLFGGAYLFYRGKSGGSPLPPVVERVVNPPAKPTPHPEPVPPSSCPYCMTVPNTLHLSKDKRAWACKKCGESVARPPETVGV